MARQYLGSERAPEKPVLYGRRTLQIYARSILRDRVTFQSDGSAVSSMSVSSGNVGRGTVSRNHSRPDMDYHRPNVAVHSVVEGGIPASQPRSAAGTEFGGHILDVGRGTTRDRVSGREHKPRECTE